MTTALLAAALSWAASVSAAPLVLATPLPGYSPELKTPPPASDAAFPSTARLFGSEPDPLESLKTSGEDLRDAVAEPTSAAALQAGLRATAVSARMTAVRSVARRRKVDAVPYLSGVLLRLDEPARLRAAAALALGRIGDKIAVPALGEALKDPSPEVRYAAALSLGRLPVDGVATRLERVLRTDPAWQPRYAAAIALGRSRKTFTVASLAESLTSDAAWQVRQQAARSLQDLGTSRAAEALEPALIDPEPSVRAAAGSAIGEIGGNRQLRALVEALKNESEPSVRAVFSAATHRAMSRA